ncbi:MAG: metallophosphoesterase [Chloroflexota bacterium]
MCPWKRRASTRSRRQISDLTIVHSSDLHIDGRDSDKFHPLCKVLDASRREGADVLLLAGDIFDHNRLDLAQIDRAARLLDDAGFPVVILPGNHDCLTADSVYRRGGLADVPGVHVFGVSSEEAWVLPERDLEIWGRPHLDYADYSPLVDPRPRTTRWQVATAHGHWVRNESDRHRSWLIHSQEINATQADYVALGHWPTPGSAGDGGVPAYYSGSPDLAQTVNVVRMRQDGTVEVTRAPLGDAPLL